MKKERKNLWDSDKSSNFALAFGNEDQNRDQKGRLAQLV